MAQKLVKTDCDQYEWREVPDEEIIPAQVPLPELTPVELPIPVRVPQEADLWRL